MNKKGSSMSGWIEGILLVILFIAVFTGVVGDMNIQYNVDHQIGLGTNATEVALINYAQSSSDKIKGGEVTQTGEGFSLKSAWGVIKSAADIVWTFMSGKILIKICNWMMLPPQVGETIQNLYHISVVLIMLAIAFKRTNT